MFHKMEEYVTINQPYGGNIDSGDEAQIIVANWEPKQLLLNPPKTEEVQP